MPDTVAGLVPRRNLISRRILRFASRAGFVLAAAIFLLFAGYRFTQMLLVPEVVIAIPREEVGYISLFSLLAKITDSDNLKLQVRAFESAVASSNALEESKADFAVVRSDWSMPRSGLTAAILRNDLILLFQFGQESPEIKPKASQRAAPKETEIQTPKQLAGRRLGLVGSFEPDRQLVSKILGESGVADVSFVQLDDDPRQVEAAVIRKDVDAIAIIAPSSRVRLILKAISHLKPTIVPVSAAGLVADLPILDQTSLAPRSLHHELPEQEIQVPTVSWRLVAGKDVERATVSSLLQTLFANRIALSQSSDLAWPIKGPEDADATYAKFPNHRGALDYYNREQQTFMDLYGDWLWLGLFAAGGVSSGFAWLFQVLSRRRKQLVESVLDRLLEILSEAREADAVKKLDELTLEIDGLVTHAIRQARWRATDPTLTTALTLAIDSSRTAIADRRVLLSRNNDTWQVRTRPRL